MSVPLDSLAMIEENPRLASLLLMRDKEREERLALKRAELERAKQRRAILLQRAIAARRKALGVCQEKKDEENFRLEIMELELEREEEEAEKEDTESTDNEDIDPVQKAVTKMTTNRARALNLKLEGLDDETIDEVLRTLIEENESVVAVLLDANDFGDASYERLNRMLLDTRRIKFLSLNYIELRGDKIEMFVEGLACTKHLVELSLGGNNLKGGDLLVLCQGLQNNTSIKTLVLTDNEIGDEGCLHLADVVKVNRTLSFVNIANNFITKGGGEAISRMIEHGNLSELNLSRNELEDIGCKPIAEVLAKNPSLQILELSDNILRKDSLVALCEALKTNTNLRSLCLKQNIYDLDCEISLQEAVISGKNRTLVWKQERTKDSPAYKGPELDLLVERFTPEKLLLWFHTEQRILEPMCTYTDFQCIVNSIRFDEATVSTFFNEIFHNNSLRVDQGRHMLETFNVLFENRIKAELTTEVTAFGTVLANQIEFISQQLKDGFETDFTFQQLQMLLTYRLVLSLPIDSVRLVLHKHHDVITSIVNLVLKFPHYSLIHLKFVEIVSILLQSDHFSLLEQFVNLHLANLVKHYNAENSQKSVSRTSQCSNLLLLFEKLDASTIDNEKLRSLFSPFDLASQK